MVTYRVVACLVAVLAVAPDASAQSSPPQKPPSTSTPQTPAPRGAQKGGDDLAIAESLFREGKAAMREKRYDEACSKFAESNRLDPQTGTLLNLAACHEAAGKTASAWGEFNEVIAQAARAGQHSRVDFAKQHASAVEAKLSRIKLTAADPSAASGATLKVDGKIVGAASIGASIPMDPGPHRLEVSAPGKRTRETPFTVPEGPSTTEIPVPSLEDPSGTPEKTETAGGGGEEETPAKKDKAGAGSGKRTLGFVVGGIGVAGLAVGAIFGASYLGKQSDYNKCTGFCGGSEAADRDQKSSAQTTGWIATAGFGVGIAGLVAGAILIATAKPTEKSAAAVRVVPAFGPKESGLSLQGNF
ncbi:type IV pilus biogenesis/stability protein PilW [Pendulispora albinea]|uniref:Tetratricopeptide repeat protein n=1 Tax=Pendulispora albinea TaxID=2741071 RepID=A0ABZ2M973_9BACT